MLHWYLQKGINYTCVEARRKAHTSTENQQCVIVLKAHNNQHYYGIEKAPSISNNLIKMGIGKVVFFPSFSLNWPDSLRY